MKLGGMASSTCQALPLWTPCTCVFSSLIHSSDDFFQRHTPHRRETAEGRKQIGSLASRAKRVSRRLLSQLLKPKKPLNNAEAKRDDQRPALPPFSTRSTDHTHAVGKCSCIEFAAGENLATSAPLSTAGETIRHKHTRSQHRLSPFGRGGKKGEELERERMGCVLRKTQQGVTVDRQPLLPVPVKMMMIFLTPDTGLAQHSEEGPGRQRYGEDSVSTCSEVFGCAILGVSARWLQRGVKGSRDR